MRIKISYKIFAINFGCISLIILASVLLFFKLSQTMFGGAVNAIDKDIMKQTSGSLVEHYEQHQSWDYYIEDEQAWAEVVNRHFFDIFFKLVERAKERTNRQFDNSITPPQSVANPGKGWEFPFGTFLERLSLLDENKNVLIKAEAPKDQNSLQSIKVNGKIVGWLSIGIVNFHTLPLGEYFYKQQMTVVYGLLIIGGLAAAIFSFFFSRHITQPIKQLTRAAKEIALHNYDYRLKVNTNDELQSLAEGFNSAFRQLDKYELQRKQWLSDISHELRTPLAILISETSAICDGLTKCDISEINHLRQDLLQMKRLVDDLHELSKFDEIGFNLKTECFDIHQLLISQIEDYQRRFSERNISLAYQGPTETLTVVADHDRILQVIRILLENCLRYTESSGHVWLKSSRNSKHLQISIEDSGPGVEKENLDKLFDRLYRTESSRNRATGGVGLGLSICRSIIDAHGATIKASNSAAGGLCITISLPSSVIAHSGLISEES